LAEPSPDPSLVGAVSIQGMPSRAECEVLAEEVNGHIVGAGTPVCRKRYLVRPVGVDDMLAELASPVDHAALSPMVAARAHAERRTRGAGRSLSWNFEVFAQAIVA